MDMSIFSMVDGRKISGVLGMDFLKNHVFRIDFDRGVFSFLKEKNIDVSASDQELELNFNTLGLLQIRGQINGQIDVDFIIDSGNNSSGSLDKEIFEKLIEQKDVKVSETLAATPSGSQKTREIRVKSFSIGNFEYKNLIFGEGNQISLGLDFLSRHIVTFDFPEMKMHLKKGNQFNRTDETDMSGLHLLRISGRTVAHSVDQESPADKGGIIAGDIIVKIDGKDADSYDMGPLRQIFCSGHGRKITLTIERSGETKELALVLEKKI